jgi:hypothetical protein
MSSRKTTGKVDGDERPSTGHNPAEDELQEPVDPDFDWEEGDPADRRRDPLRKP